VSLRDIGPDVLIKCTNIVDDIDHCLTAQTSVHLTEQRFGTRDFIDGTLADVLCDRLAPNTSRPVVFSPFGLGVLDLAVGYHVYRTARSDGRAVAIDDFFADVVRW